MTTLLIYLAILLTPLKGFGSIHPTESIEQQMYPSPVIQTLVRCPSRYEVTTSSTSCMKKIKVDLCSQY